ILRSTTQVKTFIRNRDFFKLPQALETGAEHGMWSFERYQSWMAKRTEWHVPDAADEPPDREEAVVSDESLLPSPLAAKPASSVSPQSETSRPAGPVEIEPIEGGLGEVIK